MIFLLQLAQQATTPEDINFAALFLRMLIFLGLTLLLIVFMLRKVLPLLIPGAQKYGSRTIRVLERVPIDQRKSLLVVEVQEKVYLLGSAEGQINVLMELDRAKILSQETNAPRQGSFAEILRKTLSKQKSS
ncbi:flagellar biosynthetic protein FliO [bacterium]|nr:flagellar biosynthetic protein FliO [bacterium]MCI0606953.1 flagellar biosynthetic protein FliO [bacterium]